MTLRGAVAIVGIGEIPTRRAYPGRTAYGLAAEASHMAIRDAGIRKEDINGIVTDGGSLMPGVMAEYIGIRPTFVAAAAMLGASGAAGTAIAANAIHAGMCDTVLVTIAVNREGGPPAAGGGGGGGAGGSLATEWEAPFGTAAGAGTGYAMMYVRHMHEFGTKPEQLAKVAVDQRFNALTNPNSVFQGQAITLQEVLNSRYVNYPLHILECVMPCSGGGAIIVTTAERAKAMPNRPVYLLGAGIEQGTPSYWEAPRLTTVPAKVSAARAFRMAGYASKDMQFAEFYD